MRGIFTHLVCLYRRMYNDYFCGKWTDNASYMGVSGMSCRGGSTDYPIFFRKFFYRKFSYWKFF